MVEIGDLWQVAKNSGVMQHREGHEFHSCRKALITGVRFSA